MATIAAVTWGVAACHASGSTVVLRSGLKTNRNVPVSTTSAAPTTTLAPGDAEADAAIRDVFATLINPNATSAQRQQIVTGPSSAQGDAEWARGTPDMVGASVAVYRIRFTGPTAADVVYQFFWNGGPSPIFPHPIDGVVIYSDGHWRIDQATACGLAVVAGFPCGDPNAKPPTTDTVPPTTTA
jgi:hypothetical protein